MDALELKTLDGGSTRLPAAVLERLRNGFRGELITTRDPGYDDARSIWNAMIDRRPALIARCRGTADVVDAVGLAREHGLLASIRSVGHNIAGSALCDGGLVIDLSRMRGIRVDAEARTVRVQPGACWGDLDRGTQAFGLAVPGGIVSTTGIAGLTLGGGFGWLTRKHGLTCDNLLSADIVTADGRVRVVDAAREPELFSALRGGGGNFGVVTSFEYRLHPVGPEVAAGLVLYPMDRAEAVLRFYRDFVAAAPPSLGLLAVLRRAPAAPFIPPEIHGAPVVGIAICYAGPVAEGMRAAAPIHELGPPLAGGIGPKPYVQFQRLLDAAQPPGRCQYWKSEHMAGLEDAAIRRVVEYGGNLSSPLSSVLLMTVDAPARRAPADGVAATLREATYVLNIASSWERPGESERHLAWTREFWRAMLPFSTGGTYVNFLTADDAEDRVRAAYGAAYDRLVEVKDRYDPGNLFRPAQNIRPSAERMVAG